MKIAIDKLRGLLENILIKKGLSNTEGKVLADEYIEGELQGKYSHGLTAFSSIVKKLTQPRKPIKIIKRTNVLIYIDANSNLGAIVGKMAADLAIKIAQKEGVGLIVIRNMITWLRPGTVAKLIADEDYIGIAINNGGKPMMAPPGGYEPVTGTNPIGIGVPTQNEPILVDMATAKRAWGEVRICEKLGKELPKNTFYNKRGRFTLNPKEAYSVIAAGDYKGFALGLLIEILCGSLVGMPMGWCNLKGDYRTLPRGALILVINPRMLTNIKTFKKANTELVNNIKKSKRLSAVKEIVIPGEKSLRKREQSMTAGYFKIGPKLWNELKSF